MQVSKNPVIHSSDTADSCDWAAALLDYNQAAQMAAGAVEVGPQHNADGRPADLGCWAYSTTEGHGRSRVSRARSPCPSAAQEIQVFYRLETRSFHKNEQDVHEREECQGPYTRSKKMLPSEPLQYRNRAGSVESPKGPRSARRFRVIAMITPGPRA
nr:hypothetical protein CFP56_55925 [Quercus suber]